MSSRRWLPGLDSPPASVSRGARGSVLRSLPAAPAPSPRRRFRDTTPQQDSSRSNVNNNNSRSNINGQSMIARRRRIAHLDNDVTPAAAAAGGRIGTFVSSRAGAASRVVRPAGNRAAAVGASAEVSPPSAPVSSPAPPSSEAASEQAMRLLKRMKPNELREISKAATALEKTKLEDSKKVADFVAETDNFVQLVGDCYICLEPLLSNIDSSKFGVVSWKCRCTVPQKAHSACVFSKICHGQTACDMCHSPMEFEKTRRKGTQATIRFHRDETRTDADDASSSGDSSSSDSDSSEDEDNGDNGNGNGNDDNNNDDDDDDEDDDDEDSESSVQDDGRLLMLSGIFRDLQ